MPGKYRRKLARLMMGGKDCILPAEGWRKLIDPASGAPYYQDIEKGTTQWECPTPTADPPDPPCKLPGGWKKLVTDDGHPYYQSPAGTTQWDCPNEANVAATVTGFDNTITNPQNRLET